jgi:transcriptional regulator with XRE-family HTH domain
MEKINPEYITNVRRLVGEWLREFRKDKGLTQLEVAHLLGVGEATVSKIEAGKWLSLEMLVKMSVALDFFLFLVPKNSADDLATVMRARFEIMRNADKMPS